MSATPRVPSGRPRLLVLAGLALATLVATAEPAFSQGPFRRLGDRIRERIGGPIIPSGPIQPLPSRPTGELPTTPLGRTSAAKPPLQPPLQSVETQRSANFRRAVARTPEAPQPGSRTPLGTPRSGETDRWASRTPPPPPTPDKPSTYSTDAIQAHVRSGLTVAPPAAVAAPGMQPRRPRGAQIIAVEPNSPAAAAGLKPDDRIVTIDGRLVNSVNDLLRQLDSWEPTRNLAVQVSRNDRLHTARLSSVSPDAIAGSAAGVAGANRPAPGQTPGGNRSIFGGFGAALGGLLGNRNPPAEATATDATAEDVAVDPTAEVTPLADAPLATGQPEPIAAPLPEPRAESDERR